MHCISYKFYTLFHFWTDRQTDRPNNQPTDGQHLDNRSFAHGAQKKKHDLTKHEITFLHSVSLLLYFQVTSLSSRRPDGPTVHLLVMIIQSNSCRWLAVEFWRSFTLIEIIPAHQSVGVQFSANLTMHKTKIPSFGLAVKTC